MKFRRNAPAVLIGMVVVVIAAMVAISNRLFGGLTASVEKSQFDLMGSIVQFNLKSAESRALARAEMLADMPSVQRMIATGDRPALLAEMAPLFATQRQKYGMDQLQFHLPPAVSFLRVHKPEQFGDDLSTFRPLVVNVNRTRTAARGISIARTGPAIFGVVPIKDAAGQHLGSVECGIEFGPLLDGLKAAYGLELTVFIEETPMRTAATSMDPAVFAEQNRVGKYIKLHSTHWALMQKLVPSSNLTALSEPMQYSRKALGVPYGVLLVPLLSPTGAPIGVMAVAKSFGESRSAAGRSLIWQGLLALFAMVVLTGSVLVIVRGFLVRPLGELGQRFGELAAGDKSKPIEGAESLCEELQVLAAHHETLRKQGEGDA